MLRGSSSALEVAIDVRHTGASWPLEFVDGADTGPGWEHAGGASRR